MARRAGGTWVFSAVALVVISVFLDLAIILGTLNHLRVFKDPCPDRTPHGRTPAGLGYSNSTCRRRVCYYPSWAQARTGTNARFMPENLNIRLCTHIHFAYANLSANRLTPSHPSDVDCAKPEQGMYFRVNKLKRQRGGLRTLISVGGWTFGSGPFTQMVSTKESRQEFADSAVQFIKDYSFDGLDLDWEYPGNRDSPPADRQKFTLLVQQLRRTFNDYSHSSRPSGSPLLLTAAVAPGDEKRIEKAYEVEKIHGLLDYVSIMTFDLHGPWEGMTGHNSPLYSADKLNVHWAAEYYSLKRGVPRYKLMLGFPTYGRNFMLLDAKNSAVGAHSKIIGTEVRGTREGQDFMAYYQICKKDGERKRSQTGKVPYLVNNKEWISYDDNISFIYKGGYVLANGYGGAVVWTPALDDFSGGECGQGPYPLLTILNDIICPKWAQTASGGQGQVQPFDCSKRNRTRRQPRKKRSSPLRVRKSSVAQAQRASQPV